MLLTGPMGDLDTTTAACKGQAIDHSVSPARDKFFPERGTAQVTARDAKLVCNGDGTRPPCPMREPCLEYALARKERFGIWGGMSERERARLVKQRRVEKRKRELEIEQARQRRSAAAKAAWAKRRSQAVGLEQAAESAVTWSRESGATIIKRRRRERAA